MFEKRYSKRAMSKDEARIVLAQATYASELEGTRPTFEGNKYDALAYYEDFVGFVSRVAPAAREGAKTRLLDVGCGNGWSSFAFVQAGYRATGVDLNAAAFEPPATEGLALLEASATDLPFQDRSFDVVATYQCIEHVPDPDAALKEIVRVCEPGGIVCVVGPNLISPFVPLKNLATAVARREKIPWRRTPTTPRHPYGNTLTEMLLSIPVSTSRLVRKLLAPRPSFTMREPDTTPPFHADNDACNLCNPTDFLKFFPSYGCGVVQDGKHGRPPLSYLLASGTWIAPRKL